MRKPVFLLTALLAVSVSLWWLRAGGGDPEGRGAAAYAGMLADCSPSEPPRSKEEALAVRRCVWEAFRVSYAEGGIADMASVLAPATEGDPWLRTSCHPAAHMLTEEQDFDREELLALLDDVGGSPACDWALGHAAVSGLGLLGEAGASPEELLSWCLANDADDVVFGNCIDGLGHHAWLSTSSLPLSVAVCEAVPAAVRHGCGGGVLMQLFEPATQGEAEYDRSEASATIPGFCEEWRRFARESATAEACAYGAGYVFGLDLRDAVFAEIRAAGSSSFTAPARDRVLAAVRAVEEDCAALAADIAPVCSLKVVQAVPRDLVRMDRGFAGDVCAAFSGEAAPSACRKRLGLD